MSRITKEIAEATAIALLAAKKNKIKVLEDELSNLVTGHLIRVLPKDILEAFENNPSYFVKQQRRRCYGQGLDYRDYWLNKPMPAGDEKIILTADEANDLIRINDRLDDMRKKYSELKQEIEIALYNMRTYKNVETNFPEAFKVLPNPVVNTALMINISDLRNRL